MAAVCIPVEAAHQEQMMGFFVPVAYAAYVTELLELALGSMEGVKVHAGLFNKTKAQSNGSMQVTLPDILLDIKTSEVENQPNATPKRIKTAKKRKAKNKKTETHHESTPSVSSTECCHQKIGRQLREKYGESVNNPDGTITAPRLLIQYPELPYPVPFNPEFSNYCVPRKRVELGCDDELTPLGELLPI